MATTTVIKSIGILIASLLFGMALFYLVYTGTKKERKQQLDLLLSYTIQFIIYIWLGKIIASFSIFIQDPVAVLAYPGNSTAFYIATCLTLLHLFIQQKRGKVKEELLLNAFVPVFFATSFFYGFIQISIEKEPFQIYFVWMVVLCIASLLFHQKKWFNQGNIIFMIIWSIGAFFLSLNKGYLVVFGFLLHPIYFIVIALFFSGYSWMKIRNSQNKSMEF